MNAICKQLVACVKRTFEFHRTLHPGETFYAFALVETSLHGEALTAVSVTEEAFIRDSRATPPSELGFKRFCPDEWWFDPIHPPDDDFGWKALSPLVPSLCSGGAPNGVLDAMNDTMAELDRQGVFGRGAVRENVTLMTYISDDPICDQWWPDSVRQLNSPAVFKRFQAALKPFGLAARMPKVEQMKAGRPLNHPTWQQVVDALDALARGECAILELITPAGGRLAVRHYPGHGFFVTVREPGGVLDEMLCDLSKGFAPVELEVDESTETFSGVSFCNRTAVEAAMDHFFRTGLKSPLQTWMDWMELNQRAGSK